MLGVFVMGFLAAYIDWNTFFKEMFYLRHLNNLGYFFLSFCFLLLSYFICLYIPASICVEKTMSK